MFTFLADVPAKEVIPAIHQAIRIITHLSGLHDLKIDNLWLDAKHSELSKAQNELAMKIIDAIYDHEQKRISHLDARKVSLYVRQLAEIAETASKSNVELNKIHGRNLLNKLRLGTRAHRIFISFASVDNEKYRELLAGLEKLPNFVFSTYNLPGLDYGDHSWELQNRIKKQIDRSEVILVLATASALQNQWVEFEIKYAQSINKPMIVISDMSNDTQLGSILSSADEIVGMNPETVSEAIIRRAGQH